MDRKKGTKVTLMGSDIRSLAYIPQERFEEFQKFSEEKGIEYSFVGRRATAEMEIAVDDQYYDLICDFISMKLRDPFDYLCPSCGEISRLEIAKTAVIVNATFLKNDMKTRGILTTVNASLKKKPIQAPKGMNKVLNIKCYRCYYESKEEDFTLWKKIKEAQTVACLPEALASEHDALCRLAKEKLNELEKLK